MAPIDTLGIARRSRVQGEYALIDVRATAELFRATLGHSELRLIGRNRVACQMLRLLLDGPMRKRAGLAETIT
jgi:hypothetical protein